MHDRPIVGVGIIVLKETDQGTLILLHRRKGVDDAVGTWGSGGGHLEYGESLEACALRELREEAGPKLIVNNVRFLGVANFFDFSPKHYVDISFVATWVSGEPADFGSSEAQEWTWFDICNLPSPILSIIPKYLDAYTTDRHLVDASLQ